MGPRKCSFYIPGGLKKRSFNTEDCPLGPNQAIFIIKGGLKIEGCKIEGPLYNDLQILSYM